MGKSAAYRRWERQQAALSAARAEHMDCGCVPRVVEWEATPDRCPACGRPTSVRLPEVWPTQTPIGERLTAAIGCRCGVEYERRALVVR